MKTGAIAIGPAAFGPGLAARAERGIETLVEIAAAALVCAEIAVLLCGVVSRHLLGHPLVWSDELSSILFLWLAMLGSVIAFQRGSHMRMTAIVDRVAPETRAFLEAVAVAAPLLFLALILLPSLEFAFEEAPVRTPALDLSNAWRAAALPVGMALIALGAATRLARLRDWQTAVFALAAVIWVAGGFIMAEPALRPLGNANLLIFFVGIVALTVCIGVPIAFCFGLATLGYLVLAADVPALVIVGRMDEGMSHLILLSVPLFVFLGLLLEMTGMARAMVAFLVSLLGRFRGGLSYVMVGAMYVVSGISGSKAADMAAVAPVLLPEMKERGADAGELVALLAASGAQTETIPPSLVLITLGSVTGVSIGALFAGGTIPALVLGGALCALIWWRHRKEAAPNADRIDWRDAGRKALIALPALALPFIIRAGVVEGVATATEVSTLGIVYVVLAGLFVYRRFDWGRLVPMLVATAALSGAILLIIGTATGMAWALTQSGFSDQLARAMQNLPGGATTFLVASIAAFIILGSVLEGIPAIVLFGPLMFPIAAGMGINEVHYAMVVVLAMGIGLFAPPFGVGYYSACAISGIDPVKGMRPMVGYIVVMLAGLAVVAAFPILSTMFL